MKNMASVDEDFPMPEPVDAARGVEEITSAIELRYAIGDCSTSVTMIDFYTEWCAPCKAIAPKIEELARGTPSMRCYKVDVEKVDVRGLGLEIQSVPTFMFFQDGEKVEEIAGARLTEIRGAVDRFTSNAAASVDEE